MDKKDDNILASFNKALKEYLKEETEIRDLLSIVDCGKLSEIASKLYTFNEYIKKNLNTKSEKTQFIMDYILINTRQKSTVENIDDTIYNKIILYIILQYPNFVNCLINIQDETAENILLLLLKKNESTNWQDMYFTQLKNIMNKLNNKNFKDFQESEILTIYGKMYTFNRETEYDPDTYVYVPKINILKKLLDILSINVNIKYEFYNGKKEFDKYLTNGYYSALTILNTFYINDTFCLNDDTHCKNLKTFLETIDFTKIYKNLTEEKLKKESDERDEVINRKQKQTELYEQEEAEQAKKAEENCNKIKENFPAWEKEFQEILNKKITIFCKDVKIIPKFKLSIVPDETTVVSDETTGGRNRRRTKKYKRTKKRKTHRRRRL
jgi:hypothetical protein